MPLTPRQAAILAYIRQQMAKNQPSPSIREIAEKFGISSPNGVVSHINALVRKGALTKVNGTARSLRPTGDCCPTCGREYE